MSVILKEVLVTDFDSGGTANDFLNVGENGADDEGRRLFFMFSWSTFLSCFSFTLFSKYGSYFFLKPYTPDRYFGRDIALGTERVSWYVSFFLGLMPRFLVLPSTLTNDQSFPLFPSSFPRTHNHAFYNFSRLNPQGRQRLDDGVFRGVTNFVRTLVHHEDWHNSFFNILHFLEVHPKSIVFDKMCVSFGPLQKLCDVDYTI